MKKWTSIRLCLKYIPLFRFNAYLNKSNSADSLFRLATRWFMWRMETLGLITVLLTAIVTVATKVCKRILYDKL